MSKLNELKRPTKPFRNVTGKRYTSALFFDMAKFDPKDKWTILPVFTLFEDKPGYINARKTFVELNDPTGYQWAIEYLGDYSHWELLMKTKWFSDAVQKWREELKIKQRAEAIQKIVAISQDPSDKQALTAAKYIAEQGWNKDVSNRGRPSKAEVNGALKRAVEQATVEDEDMQRIGLVKKG